MNDLPFIYYDAKSMFFDTLTMTIEGENSHRRLCDYTWTNDGPPKNDNETLRIITKTREANWGRVKSELLARGWIETGEYFLHRRVIKSLNEAKERWVASHNRTAKANNLAPLTLSKPDSVTGCVTINATPNVTSTVTPHVTKNVTEVQSESESESEKKEQVSKRQISQSARADATKLTLKLIALDRVAKEILSNKTGWFYDNCKVKPDDFTQASLQTVLKPFAEKITEQHALDAWHEAVKRTHAAAVDEMIDTTVAGYCIACWRELLGKG